MLCTPNFIGTEKAPKNSIQQFDKNLKTMKGFKKVHKLSASRAIDAYVIIFLPYNNVKEVWSSCLIAQRLITRFVSSKARTKQEIGKQP